MKQKMVSCWFKDKSYTNGRRQYACEFNVRYEQAPFVKIIRLHHTEGSTLTKKMELESALISTISTFDCFSQITSRFKIRWR